MAKKIVLDDSPKVDGKEFSIKYIVIFGYGSALENRKVKAANEIEAVKLGEKKLRAEFPDASAITFTGEIF